jgi:alkylation response protein AidB-like acyl-CoA dehydrogenase
MLQSAVREMLARDAAIARIREWTEADDLRTFSSIAAGQGWFAIGVPEELGGQGGGLIERALLLEEIGRAGAPSGGLLAAAVALDLAAATPDGTPHLQAVMDGDEETAFARPASHPPDRPAAGAPTQDRQRISGNAALVLNAPVADRLLVPVETDDGTSLWTVDPRGEGAHIRERPMVDRTRRFGDVELDVAHGDRVGSVPAEALRRAAARAAVLIAAESLGLARRMLDMTTGYVKDREQFGVPVGSFQAVKHAAAQALVDIEAAHSGVYFAAWALEHDHPEAELHAWIAKAFSGEMGARVADTALQLHGAIGYTWEYDLHVFFKRAKANQELFGASRHYRDRVADVLQLTAPAQTPAIA